jgi:hypothetical protein
MVASCEQPRLAIVACRIRSAEASYYLTAMRQMSPARGIALSVERSYFATDK